MIIIFINSYYEPMYIKKYFEYKYPKDLFENTVIFQHCEQPTTILFHFKLKHLS